MLAKTRTIFEIARVVHVISLILSGQGGKRGQEQSKYKQQESAHRLRLNQESRPGRSTVFGCTLKILYRTPIEILFAGNVIFKLQICGLWFWCKLSHIKGIKVAEMLLLSNVLVIKRGNSDGARGQVM